MIFLKFFKKLKLALRDSVSFFIYIFISFFKGTGNRHVVLVYHSIGYCNADEDPFRINISPEIFERHLKIISKYRNRIKIAFDDGYRNNFEYAYPLLKKYKLDATIFLITDFIDQKIGSDSFAGKCFKQQPLSWEEIKIMYRGGIKFGSHSKTHSLLGSFSKSKLQEELSGSKARIEEELGHPIRAFAYPFGGRGAFTDFTKSAVMAAGYDCAYTNIMGDSSKDRFALKRIRIYREDGSFKFRMKIEGAYDWVDRVRDIL